MWPNLQFPADLVKLTEEILNGKLHLLCSDILYVIPASSPSPESSPEPENSSTLPDALSSSESTLLCFSVLVLLAVLVGFTWDFILVWVLFVALVITFTVWLDTTVALLSTSANSLGASKWKTIYFLSLIEKCPNAEFFLVCVFLYSDWIRIFTPYLDTFHSVIYMFLYIFHKIKWHGLYSTIFRKFKLWKFGNKCNNSKHSYFNERAWKARLKILFITAWRTWKLQI